MVRITDEPLALYMSLFRGRTDVYARHWEKEGRSGYSPAYKLDWKEFSDFDKEISFDRLFPNQDSVPKEGFGNLIALPLQGQAVQNSNTVFLDPEKGIPYPDQWEFLRHIKKHTASELDAVHAMFFQRTASHSITAPARTETTKLSLTLDNKITLHRPQLNSELVHFLREHLNFMNTEYLVKQRIGKSLYNIPKYFLRLKESSSSTSDGCAGMTITKLFLITGTSKFPFLNGSTNKEPGTIEKSMHA